MNRRRKIDTAVAILYFLLAAMYFFVIWQEREAYREGDDYYAQIRSLTEEGAVEVGTDEELVDSEAAESLAEAVTTTDDATEGGGSGEGESGRDGLERISEDDVAKSADAVMKVTAGADALQLPKVDFETLRETCPDLVAWLYCPGTVIDNPIVQGDDNSYYLTHLADGTKNKNGCLFIDMSNVSDFSDDNTLIYGHNMASGSMFASLLDYADQDYYQAHPVMYLITEDTTYRVDLFSAYTTNPEGDAYYINLGGKEPFMNWIADCAKQSDFQTSMTLRASDHMITLSTCAYSAKNARYVVQGRLTEMEEN